MLLGPPLLCSREGAAVNRQLTGLTKVAQTRAFDSRLHPAVQHCGTHCVHLFTPPGVFEALESAQAAYIRHARAERALDQLQWQVEEAIDKEQCNDDDQASGGDPAAADAQPEGPGTCQEQQQEEQQVNDGSAVPKGLSKSVSERPARPALAPSASTAARLASAALPHSRSVAAGAVVAAGRAVAQVAAGSAALQRHASSIASGKVPGSPLAPLAEATSLGQQEQDDIHSGLAMLPPAELATAAATAAAAARQAATEAAAAAAQAASGAAQASAQAAEAHSSTDAREAAEMAAAAARVAAAHAEQAAAAALASQRAARAAAAGALARTEGHRELAHSSTLIPRAGARRPGAGAPGGLQHSSTTMALHGCGSGTGAKLSPRLSVAGKGDKPAPGSHSATGAGSAGGASAPRPPAPSHLASSSLSSSTSMAQGRRPGSVPTTPRSHTQQVAAGTPSPLPPADEDPCVLQAVADAEAAAGQAASASQAEEEAWARALEADAAAEAAAVREVAHVVNDRWAWLLHGHTAAMHTELSTPELLVTNTGLP
jgi:hypothetical protein